VGLEEMPKLIMNDRRLEAPLKNLSKRRGKGCQEKSQMTESLSGTGPGKEEGGGGFQKVDRKRAKKTKVAEGTVGRT